MSRKIITALGVAFVGMALTTTVSAQQPASAAQLSVLEAAQQTDRAELGNVRTELQTLQAQISAKQQAYDSYVDPIQNPGTWAATQTGRAALQGQNPLDTGYATLVAKNQIYNEIKALKARVPSLLNKEAQIESRIAARERSIAYARNPRQVDLENEQARLDNLNRQQPTKDDGGQLEWDKKNTNKRIEDLQKEFQQGGESSSGASTGQSQGAYGAPTSPTGPQSQLPGYDASWGPMGYPPRSGPQMPTYEGLQRDIEPPRGHQPSQKNGSSKQKHSGSKGGCDC
jgi:hypothetical protein